MDAREQRGLAIAATTKLQSANGAWLVPSQSGNGRYTVDMHGDTYRCNCPDHESRGVKCKHIFAEQVFRFNYRKGTDAERFVAALGMVNGKRLTYDELTSAYGYYYSEIMPL